MLESLTLLDFAVLEIIPTPLQRHSWIAAILDAENQRNQSRRWCNCSSTTKTTASVTPTWGFGSTFTLQPEDQVKIGNFYALILIPSLPKGAFTKFWDHRLKFIELFPPGNISQKMVWKEMLISVADVQDFQTKAKVWVPSEHVPLQKEWRQAFNACPQHCKSSKLSEVAWSKWFYPVH